MPMITKSGSNEIKFMLTAGSGSVLARVAASPTSSAHTAVLPLSWPCSSSWLSVARKASRTAFCSASAVGGATSDSPETADGAPSLSSEAAGGRFFRARRADCSSAQRRCEAASPAVY